MHFATFALAEPSHISTSVKKAGDVPALSWTQLWPPRCPGRVWASPRGLWTTLRNSGQILPEDSGEDAFKCLIYYYWPFSPSYFKPLTFNHCIFFFISSSTSFLPIRGGGLGVVVVVMRLVSANILCLLLDRQYATHCTRLVFLNPHNSPWRQVLLLSWFWRWESWGRRH